MKACLRGQWRHAWVAWSCLALAAARLHYVEAIAWMAVVVGDVALHHANRLVGLQRERAELAERQLAAAMQTFARSRGVWYDGFGQRLVIHDRDVTVVDAATEQVH